MSKKTGKKTGKSVVSDRLTPNDEKFCQEYVRTSKVADSYLVIRPDLIDRGWKKATIAREATRYKNKPKIQKRINELLKEAANVSRISVNRVLNEFKLIGFCDIKDFLDESGDVTNPKTWRRGSSAAVASYKKVTSDNGYSTTEIKFHPKLKALDALSRHLHLFGDNLLKLGEIEQANKQAVIEAVFDGRITADDGAKLITLLKANDTAEGKDMVELFDKLVDALPD